MKNKTCFTPETGTDYTPLVRRALQEPECGGLHFAPGRYDFHSHLATEQYLFVSNNDEGLKRIVFPLCGRKDFAVEGPQAEFFFHGELVPFLLDECQSVRLSGFSIDWDVPFHGEAVVIAASGDAVDLEIRSGFPFRVRDGRLEFGPRPDTFEIRNILEFDSERRETAFKVFDNFGVGRRHHAEVIGPDTVRLTAALREPLPHPGNVLAILSDRRDSPAIVARGCRGVELRDVTIHHAGAMGLIAQRCEDLALHGVRVVPRADGSRMLSTTADATHFVNCRGNITIEGCRFENQMDDATNVHGIYAPITRVLGPAEFELRLAHRQQRGIDLAAPGEVVELVDHESLATFHTAPVEHIERVNKEFLRIRLATPPSRPPREGDAVGNVSWSADLTIRGCSCHGNRARGFLISTPGRVLIEENTMHVPGAAILIEGDANFWFESGCVRDVLIRRNTFEDCNYGIWGKAAIQLSPGIQEGHQADNAYHRNVRIEDNLFRVFDPRIVRARGVDGLIVRGNQILGSSNYPAQNSEAPSFDTEGCLNVTLHNNLIEPPAHVPSHTT